MPANWRSGLLQAARCVTLSPAALMIVFDPASQLPTT